MAYKKEELHALGYAYGLITRRVSEKKGKKLNSPATFSEACARPQTGLAIAMQQAHSYKALTDELNERLAFLLGHVQYIPDDPTERLSVEEQGVWQIGYYRGYGELPALLSDETEPQNGIRAARKAKGLTQTELAKKVGCKQVEISRWESGKIQPTIESLKAIANALDYPIEKLISPRAPQ